MGKGIASKYIHSEVTICDNCYHRDVKVGDTIYVIPSDVNYRLNVANNHNENNKVYKQIVESITFYTNGDYLFKSSSELYLCHNKLYKENWFLTYAEAERALKEMEGAE